MAAQPVSGSRMVRARWIEDSRAHRVTTMIANRFMQQGFVLVFSAETTRARVTGHILKD